MRGVTAPQWVVVPPTVLASQAGKPGLVFAGAQSPLLVRGSSQVSCAKASFGTCEKLAVDSRLPASSSTTLIPRRVSSCASVPPPAPEPMITMAPSSFRSTLATRASRLAGHRAAVGLRHFGQPAQVVEAAEEVAAFRIG